MIIFIWQVNLLLLCIYLFLKNTYGVAVSAQIMEREDSKSEASIEGDACTQN